MFRRHVARIAIAIAVCGLHSAAHAQGSTSGSNPMDSFGSARLNPRQRQVMTLTLSGDGAIDRDQAAAGQATPFGGPHANVRAGLMYRRQHGSRAFSVNGSTGVQHYPGAGDMLPVTHSLDVGFSTALGRHTQVQFTQRAVRSPFFTVSLPGVGVDADAPPLMTDFETFRWNNTALSSGLVVSQAVGRRSSLTLTYASQNTQMEGGRSVVHTAGASYNYRLNRYATARMGYSRRLMARQSAVDVTLEPGARQSHDIDLGVDYNRPLSLSRRTKLAFSSGSSLVPSDGRTHVQVSGRASLSREFGRSWTTSLDYGRHAQFIETLSEPLLSDSLSLQVQGAPLRRLKVGVSASASIGQVGFGAGNREFDTHLASVRARWTLNRFLVLYGDSSYYRHAFGSAVTIVPGLRRNVDRREVRIGLMTWVPLLH